MAFFFQTSNYKYFRYCTFAQNKIKMHCEQSASPLSRSTFGAYNKSVINGRTLMTEDLFFLPHFDARSFDAPFNTLSLIGGCGRAAADEPQQQRLLQFAQLQLRRRRLEHHFRRGRCLRRRNQALHRQP